MGLTDWLERQYYGFLISKNNDVELEVILKAIRAKAKKKGYTEKQMNAALKAAKKFKESINESSRDKQHTEPVQQTEPREAEQVPQLQGLQEKTEQELSRRAQNSNQPVPDGLTESGTRKSGAAGGRSIVDGIL